MTSKQSKNLKINLYTIFSGKLKFISWFNIIVATALSLMTNYLLFKHLNAINIIILLIIFLIFTKYTGTKIALVAITTLLSIIFPILSISKKLTLISPSNIDVIISTNSNEVFDFFSTLPKNAIVIALTFFFIVLYSLRRCKKNLLSDINIKSNLAEVNIVGKNRRESAGGGVLVITSICIITSAIFIYKNQNKFNPFLNSITELYTYNLNTPTWKTIDIVNQDKELYVLIIGESCRRDGLSLYNNTVDTTPFLNSVNKKYINYFISTAVNTTLSVPRLLALSDNQGIVAEENNILNIANESGLETYWISSQGYTGKYNISSSRISNFSKNKTFLKAGDDDLKLIPLLEKAIENPSKKLIILHTMGSHVNPKHRLYNFPQKIKTQKGDYIDAYLNSIRKTDYFLEQVYNVLAKSKKTFSMIYVSDHGVNINKNKNAFTEKRDDQKIQSYGDFQK